MISTRNYRGSMHALEFPRAAVRRPGFPVKTRLTSRTQTHSRNLALSRNLVTAGPKLKRAHKFNRSNKRKSTEPCGAHDAGSATAHPPTAPPPTPSSHGPILPTADFPINGGRAITAAHCLNRAAALFNKPTNHAKIRKPALRGRRAAMFAGPPVATPGAWPGARCSSDNASSAIPDDLRFDNHDATRPPASPTPEKVTDCITCHTDVRPTCTPRTRANPDATRLPRRQRRRDDHQPSFHVHRFVSATAWKARQLRPLIHVAQTTNAPEICSVFRPIPVTSRVAHNRVRQCHATKSCNCAISRCERTAHVVGRSSVQHGGQRTQKHKPAFGESYSMNRPNRKI